MSLFRDYIGGVITGNELEKFGLPKSTKARGALTKRVQDLGGNADRGFDFASASARILLGTKEPRIIHTGEKEIIIPTILHESIDKPFWECFRFMFPQVADNLHVDLFCRDVPAWENIANMPDPTILAVQKASRILCVEAFAGALERHPDLQIWDTNPSTHIIVTFERFASTLDLAPQPSPVVES